MSNNSKVTRRMQRCSGRYLTQRTGTVRKTCEDREVSTQGNLPQNPKEKKDFFHESKGARRCLSPPSFVLRDEMTSTKSQEETAQRQRAWDKRRRSRCLCRKAGGPNRGEATPESAAVTRWHDDRAVTGKPG